MKKLFAITLLLGLSLTSINWTTDEEELRCAQCTKDTVQAALKSLDVKYADVVYAQIMLESGDLKSKLVLMNNNLLGMRHPKKRQTTSTKSTHGYATYTDWYACLEDYVLYQQNVLKSKNLSKKQYIAYLARTYAKDPQYKVKLIKKIKQSYAKI